MTAQLGDILNLLAACVFFPALLLPLTALIAPGASLRGAAVWIGLTLAVIAACASFAWLAVDLAPLSPSRPQIILLFGALVSIGALIATRGARALTDAIAAPAEKITRSLGAVTLWFVLAMALIQFCVVILRYVFGMSFIFMQESVTYLHGAIFLIAAGYALLTDDHVRVDIFYRDASPRHKALIDFAGTYLLLFPFCLITLWAASPYVGASWSVHEGSNEQSGIQGVFLLKTLIPIYATLLAMAGFVLAARAGKTIGGVDDGSA
jgi:TRAP-type mannitol/chloroaromatic compound transport system permease small subunit